MPHIPEEELHAYLDQALGRLQCVEIESHLAECTRCRTARDEIAALRDRTTAMLARLAPHRSPPPPLAEIRRRAAARAFVRERRLQRAAWAASVVVALGVGWGASALVHPPTSPPLGTAPTGAPVVIPGATAAESAAPVPIPLPIEPRAVEASEPAAQTPSRAEPAAKVAVTRRPRKRPRAAEPGGPAPEAPVAEVANVGGIAKDGQLELGGVWRNLSWDGAKEQAGDTPPRIDGLPVTEVQMQAGDSGHKPLMVVAQQLASGEVIRTIEGPVSDVSALLGSRPGEMADLPAAGTRPPAPSALGSAFSFRHGDRMFAVTGSLPSDSLRAMMRRLNLMSRVR